MPLSSDFCGGRANDAVHLAVKHLIVCSTENGIAAEGHRIVCATLAVARLAQGQLPVKFGGRSSARAARSSAKSSLLLMNVW
jgi:hypothetical protein